MPEIKRVYILTVYNGMGNQTICQRYTSSAKAAAEWMMRVSQNQDARLSTRIEP